MGETRELGKKSLEYECKKRIKSEEKEEMNNIAGMQPRGASTFLCITKVIVSVSVLTQVP